MKSLTYSRDLALSNKYLEVIIQSLEPRIFTEIVGVLFDFFNFIESRECTKGNDPRTHFLLNRMATSWKKLAS